MPYLKADDPMPARPVVIAVYGEPGVRKTSLGHTAETPLTIDCDNGVGRSWGRKDALLVDSWEEVLEKEKEGFYKKFKTIIIDTAKSALDDYLMTYVCRLDAKNMRNKLQAYGAIGDEFKRFVNARRQEGADIIIIAHAKKDEDTRQRIPDVTGQSYNLILRIADQVGFASSKNNSASIQWTPTDFTVGKNTAGLPEVPIPDKTDPTFKTFMADIITKVKAALVRMSEAQKEAEEKSERYQKEIKKAKTPDALNEIITPVSVLPKVLKDALYSKIKERATALGLLFDKEKKQFYNPRVEEMLPVESPAEEVTAGHEDDLPFN